MMMTLTVAAVTRFRPLPPPPLPPTLPRLLRPEPAGGPPCFGGVWRPSPRAPPS